MSVMVMWIVLMISLWNKVVNIIVIAFKGLQNKLAILYTYIYIYAKQNYQKIKYILYVYVLYITNSATTQKTYFTHNGFLSNIAQKSACGIYIYFISAIFFPWGKIQNTRILLYDNVICFDVENIILKSNI